MVALEVVYELLNLRSNVISRVIHGIPISRGKVLSMRFFVKIAARAAFKGHDDYKSRAASVCPTECGGPIPRGQKVSGLIKRSHFVVVTVCSTRPLASRRTACVTPCTATREFACGVAVTPSFTCAQSIRSVPISLNTSP